MKIFLLFFLLSTFVFASLKSEIQEGVSFYKSKQYERALEIFDRILIEHPNSKRARLEYARVLYAMGRYDEAKKEFTVVLKSKNLPPLVRKNIKWFLKKIERKKKKNFFSGFVAVGTTEDSNIENKSDNPVYAGFVDSNIITRKDRYITKELYLQHKRVMQKGIWKNAFYIYDEAVHDESKDRISYSSFTTSYIFLINGLRVSLPVGLSYTDIDKKRYLKTISFKPEVAKKVSKRHILSCGLTYEKDDNKDNKDRSYKLYGLSLKWLSKLKGFSNRLGVGYKRYKRVRGDRIFVAKRRVSMDLSTSYSLLTSNFLTLFYKKIKDTYQEKDPSIQSQRVDKTDRYNFNFQQNISKSRYFQLGFSKISNKSNLDIFSYDKRLYTFKLTQTF